MTAFNSQFSQTATGSVLMDPSKEVSWAAWCHLLGLTPEKFVKVNDSSTQFRNMCQAAVFWTRNGNLTGTGADTVFDTSVLPCVEPLISDGPGSEDYMPMHNAGFYLTDNTGVGGNPSNYTFHERAFIVYSFFQLSRVTTIIRCEGDLTEPPFSRLVDCTLCLTAVGVAP